MTDRFLLMPLAVATAFCLLVTVANAAGPVPVTPAPAWRVAATSGEHFTDRLIVKYRQEVSSAMSARWLLRRKLKL